MSAEEGELGVDCRLGVASASQQGWRLLLEWARLAAGVEFAAWASWLVWATANCSA